MPTFCHHWVQIKWQNSSRVISWVHLQHDTTRTHTDASMLYYTTIHYCLHYTPSVFLYWWMGRGRGGYMTVWLKLPTLYLYTYTIYTPITIYYLAKMHQLASGQHDLRYTSFTYHPVFIMLLISICGLCRLTDTFRVHFLRPNMKAMGYRFKVPIVIHRVVSKSLHADILIDKGESKTHSDDMRHHDPGIVCRHSLW